MARKDTPDEAPAKQGRLAQIRSAYTMTRKVDPAVGWVTAATAFLVLAVAVAIGFLIGHPIYLGVIGLMVAVLAATIVFGKRAEKAAFSQVDGQPGAAAAALNMLRKGWTVTPAVAMSRNQDIVHRVVGRAGVVLVGEGSPSRVQALIVTEKKKVARFVPDVPIYDVQAGNDDRPDPAAQAQQPPDEAAAQPQAAAGDRGQPQAQGARLDEPADPQGPDAAQRPDAARPPRLTAVDSLLGPLAPRGASAAK